MNVIQRTVSKVVLAAVQGTLPSCPVPLHPLKVILSLRQSDVYMNGGEAVTVLLVAPFYIYTLTAVE